MLADENTVPADREAIKKFAGAPDATLLRIDGNALALSWPMSRAGYENEFGSNSENFAKVEAMRSAGVGIGWADQVASFSLGKKDDEITRVASPFSKNQYTPNAVAPARARLRLR